MLIRPEDYRRCTDCGGDVVLARTSRTSKGEPVDVVLDVEEVDSDLLSVDVGKQWMVSQQGSKFHAGQPASKAHRAALIAAKVGFHLAHKDTCNKRRAAGRR